jgi:hypothetical protein
MSSIEGVHRMPARKPSPPDEKPQRERFIEGAREVGASEDPEDFERAFAKVMKPGDVTPSALPSRRSGKPASS